MTNVVAGAYAISAKTIIDTTGATPSWIVTCTLDAGGGYIDTAEFEFDVEIDYNDLDIDHHATLNMESHAGSCGDGVDRPPLPEHRPGQRADREDHCDQGRHRDARGGDGMTARLMKMSAVAETRFVEKTRKPARPAAKPAAPRKRAPVKPAVPTDASVPPEASAQPRGRRRNVLLWSSLIILAAGSTAAGLLFLRGGDQSEAGAAAAVSAATLDVFCELARRPRLLGRPDGCAQARADVDQYGTFVRYLPLSASIGDSSRAITVGTYPMRNAYATAAAGRRPLR